MYGLNVLSMMIWSTERHNHTENIVNEILIMVHKYAVHNAELVRNGREMRSDYTAIACQKSHFTLCEGWETHFKTFIP